MRATATHLSQECCFNTDSVMRNTNTRPTPTQSLGGIALTGASTASQRRSLAVFAPVTLTVPALCFLPFRSIVPYALCSPMSIIRYELAAQSDSLHALSLWRTNATSTTESSLPTRADRVNRAETPGCAPCSGIRSAASDAQAAQWTPAHGRPAKCHTAGNPRPR